MKKNGFTLVETLISLSILGSVSVAGMQYLADERDKDLSYNFIKNVNDVVNAVDTRIAIDGYDPDLWNDLSWSNEDTIISDLVKKELQSINSNCSGTWNPSLNSEKNTSLLPCNFTFNSSKLNVDMSAKIKNDTSGFIKQFEIVFNFKDNASFQDNLINIRTAMKNIDTYEKRENSGMHSMYFVDKTNTEKEISSFECINNIGNCSFKAIYDRSGGNEYLRADGGNSIIGEHITFIESKGQSPMKCIRWANESRDGTGLWTQTLDEDCGIGIYKNDPHPVMLDVVADTGTFKNILLDQECTVYSWDGTNVVDSGNLSPCGINNSNGEIFQVVENISTKDLGAINIYGTNSFFAVSNIKNIIADTIQANTLKVLDEFKVSLIKELNVGQGIKMDNNVQISQVLNVIGDTFIDSNLSVNGSIDSDSINSNSAKITGNLDVAGNTKSNTLNVTGKSVLGDVDLTNLKSSSDITANGSLNVNGNLNLNKVVSENSGCSQNGEIARNSVGKILSCISGVWRSSSSTNQTRIIMNYNVSYRWPAASVYCNSDEVVTGGGSACHNGVGYTFLVRSEPSGNGWFGACDTTKNVNTQINVYAICLKIN